MGVIIVGSGTGTGLEVDTIPKAARVILYDALGNPAVASALKEGDAWDPTAVRGVPFAGQGQNDWQPSNRYFATGTAWREAVLPSFDVAGNLASRGQVLTDEESFRNCFPGISLNTDLAGTVDFNGTTAVVGHATAFTSLNNQVYIKVKADAETAWVRIASIEDDTHLTLVDAYGSSALGVVANRTYLPTVTGAGGSITVGSSLVNVLSGTTASSKTNIWRAFDYLPLAITCTGVVVSQRVVNQEGYLGFIQDQTQPPDVGGAAGALAVVVFDGTDNTKVKFRCAWLASDAVEEVQVSLPALSGVVQPTTATAHTYTITVLAHKAILVIDGVVAASCISRLPDPYVTLNFCAGWYNSGVPTTSTLTIDTMFLCNQDYVEVGAQQTGQTVGVVQYDRNGNIMGPPDKSIPAATQGYLGIAGLDAGKVSRAARVGEYGTQRTTTEQQLWHDAFEGSNINTGWTQSTTTFTIAQANGVLTLNNSGQTTANAVAIITSVRQFPKYPRQPLYARFRAQLTANGTSHAMLAEMGFGAPSGVTALINNGAWFRWRADGTLAICLNYGGGTEQVTQVLAAGVINVANYYYYDVIVDDDFVRFIMSDAAGAPLVDQQVAMTSTLAYQWQVSHLPTFVRAYEDATGGGTLAKLLISAHTVQLLDALNNKTWAEQQASCFRHWNQNPLTQAQTAALASSAPGGGTPSNTATVYTTLGGEYIATMTAASENMLSLFGFQVPSPYTLYIRGVYWSLPYVSTVFSIAATAPYILPFLLVNLSSTNISTATGRIGFPFGQMWTAAIAAAVGTLLTGNVIQWTPQTAIACLPGTYVHLGWKVLNAGAVTTGQIRGSVLVDGYYE